MSCHKRKAPAQSSRCGDCRRASVWLGARPGLPCPDSAYGGRSRPAEAGLGLYCRSEFGRNGTSEGSSGGRKKRVV
jgi:hypothetical protein